MFLRFVVEINVAYTKIIGEAVQAEEFRLAAVA